MQRGRIVARPSSRGGDPLDREESAVPTPQTGIFALGTLSHVYLEFDVARGSDGAGLVALVAGLREPRTTIGGVNLVAGFRPELWAMVAPDAAPPDVTGFLTGITGADGYTMPPTQHDVVVWLAGSTYDAVFDVSRGVVAALAGRAILAHEMVGWPYHHDLDLTGFMDGTENPTLVDAASVALLPAGSPGESGSILLLQQWEHDAGAWEALPRAAQEAAIGRRKADSVELDPRPPSSHVARTDQDLLGRIFRRNIGYGTLVRHGTIFVGFSASQQVLRAMLERMVGRDDGIRDELTRFTRPVTGAYYVVPAAERLAAFGTGIPA
jgi:putative iron-dependent peroxidase